MAGLFALLGCAFGATQAPAQTVDEQAVKAGFIFNFIKFTQWVGVPEGDTRRLQVCTTADKPLGGQIAKLAGRSIGSRPIEVRNNTASNDLAGCDVLFIPESDAHRAETYLRNLGNAPVLTVGDFQSFTKSGGMIALRMQDYRLKFDVNLISAQRAGLQLNSQMLKLAGEVLK